MEMRAATLSRLLLFLAFGLLSTGVALAQNAAVNEQVCAAYAELSGMRTQDLAGRIGAEIGESAVGMEYETTLMVPNFSGCYVAEKNERYSLHCKGGMASSNAAFDFIEGVAECFRSSATRLEQDLVWSGDRFRMFSISADIYLDDPRDTLKAARGDRTRIWVRKPYPWQGELRFSLYVHGK